MSQDFVAVLDLGTTKAVCLIASMQGEKVKIHAVASTHSKALRKGVLADYEEAAKALDVVIRRAEQDFGQEVGNLIVSISGGHIQSVSAQGLKMIVPRSRQITNQDVMEVIKHSRSIMLGSDREQIQAIPRFFTVDGNRDANQPVGVSGGRLEVSTLIVSGDSEAISKLEKAVGMTGHKIDQIIVAPLAAGIGVLKPSEMSNGAVVVDIGGSLTEIAIFQEGSLSAVASFPVGGEHVSNDISQLLKTTFDEAERLKLAHGSALASKAIDAESVEVMQEGQERARPMQRRVLCEIIESRMKEIAKMTSDTLIKNGVEALTGGIVLTGGGAQLENTDQLFAEHFPTYKVRIAEPDLGAKIQKEPGMATAVGLARYALQCQEELMPATGPTSWRDRVKGLFSK
ncbi:cell division protein FtsA [soil metagenome]